MYIVLKNERGKRTLNLLNSYSKVHAMLFLKR